MCISSTYTACASAFEDKKYLPNEIPVQQCEKQNCVDRNKIDLQNKYCYRQAEMGIGDCGGLQVT